MSERHAFGWNCRACSFYHRYPVSRCQMCDQPRISKQDMVNFVQGKPIPPLTSGNVVELLSSQESTENSNKKPAAKREKATNNIPQPQQIAAPSTSSSSTRSAPNEKENRAAAVPPAATAPPPRNPYAKASSGTNNTAAVAVSVSGQVAAASATRPQHPHGQQQPIPPQQNQQQNHPFFDEKKRRLLLDQPKDRRTYKAGPVRFNPELSKTYIYPQNDEYPIREYQAEMTETALNYNTLISLPTGLGKTHIAAVVMYNFHRWFAPVGKIIFLAPTLPLVNQQVKACYNIMGIPGEDTAVMTGRIKSEDRRRLWKEKRVFYCTPQTVQKDFHSIMEEANNSGESSLSEFATQVVCLVLDEAHKATGEYAYTKVIELLENSGAKFRVVGLSATPGTSIKAVQGVIDALRIVRLAAKTEKDASVAQYLHQKVAEVITCERSSHSREVERLFSNLIGPMLDRLRQQGGLSHTGNATLAAYSVLVACQDYQKILGPRQDGSLVSCFHTARALMTIRSECHTSLGTVKMKMVRLKNDPQRGCMSRVVKSAEFEEIFQKVVEATGGDEEGAVTVKDPKLARLCHILKHHFIVAQGEGKDSRAIVFAQFRDSVGEIVDALQQIGPGIRARHFVGQGNGKSKKKDGKNPVDDRLKGMKQPEQQKVISQFKEDVYNVLVCTSIGEEGLDIGEVDLIVNYDVISSPIRTIQRAGRTGRKRDGRVISLISEGKEVQTYNKRLQSEQNLANALTNPQRFTMHPHRPMFPSVPSREFQKMDIQSQLHMSQVEGAHKTPSTGKRGASKGRRNTSAWKLDDDEELERSQLCREPLVLDKDISWNALTKYFLKCQVDPARLTWKQQRRREKLLKKRGQRRRGRNFDILNSLEGPTNTHGSTRRGYNKFKAVFPVEPVKEDALFSLSDDPLSMPHVKKTLWHDVESNGYGEAQNDRNEAAKNSATVNEDQSGLGDFNNDLQQNDDDQAQVAPNEAEVSMFDETIEPNRHLGSMENEGENSPANDSMIVGAARANDPPIPLAQPPPEGCVLADRRAHELRDSFRLPTPPPSSSSSDEDSEDDESVDEAIRLLPFGSSTGPQTATAQITVTTKPYEPSHNEFDLGVSGAGPLRIRERIREKMLPVESIQEEEKENDDAMLSSLIKEPSEKKQEEEQENDDAMLSSLVKKPSKNTPTIGAEKDVMLSSLVKKKKKKTSSALEPESSDKKSSSAQKSDGDVMLVTLKKKRKRLSNRTQKTVADSQAGSSIADQLLRQNCSQEGEGDIIGGRNYKRPQIGSPESDAGYVFPTRGMPASATQEYLTRQTPSQNEVSSPNALQDTPDAKGQSPGPKQRGSGGFLTDTPLRDEEDVQCELFCQVCRCTDSNEGDMIVLCDACDAGYHQRCYSIPDDVLNANTTWFCDKCTHQSKSPFAAFDGSCIYCSKSDGAMRNRDNGWCHCLCSMFEDKVSNSKCSVCSRGRAVKCEECVETIHPHCALAANWTIVIPKTSGCNQQMYCPQHTNRVVETNDVRVISSAKLKRNGSDGRPKKIQRKALQPVAEPDKESDEDEEKKERRKRRRDVLARFALEEADASDYDDADEEAEARRIEEEEDFSQDSFINDNAQLSQHFSQDELDVVDPDAAGGQIDYSHRALDAQREIQNQFGTPIFNRRMRGDGDGSQSVASSQRGLGNMNFVRSVLEHGRQGGDAEEIERMYNQLGQEGSTSPAASAREEWASQSPDLVASNTAAEYHPSGNIEGSSLTAEQLVQIEANRQEALRRRAQRQQNEAQN